MTTPDPITPEALARLRALHAAATPGPWESTGDDGNVLGAKDDPTCCILGPDTNPRIRQSLVTEHIRWSARRKANHDLIAASRNALPALLDEVERLRAVHAQEVQVTDELWEQAKPYLSAVDLGRTWAGIIKRLAEDEKHAVAEVAKLRASLMAAMEFARHAEGCSAVFNTQDSSVRYPCKCGWDDVKREIEATK